MACPEKNKLFELFKGILNAGEARDIRNHIECCAACREDFQTLEEIGALSKHLEPALPPDEYLEGLLKKIDRRIDKTRNETPKAPIVFYPNKLLRYAAALMLIVGIAACLLLISRKEERQPQIYTRATSRHPSNKVRRPEPERTADNTLEKTKPAKPFDVHVAEGRISVPKSSARLARKKDADPNRVSRVVKEKPVETHESRMAESEKAKSIQTAAFSLRQEIDKSDGDGDGVFTIGLNEGFDEPEQYGAFQSNGVKFSPLQYSMFAGESSDTFLIQSGKRMMVVPRGALLMPEPGMRQMSKRAQQSGMNELLKIQASNNSESDESGLEREIIVSGALQSEFAGGDDAGAAVTDNDVMYLLQAVNSDNTKSDEVVLANEALYVFY